MAIKHTKIAIPDVNKVDCVDWNVDHTVDSDVPFSNNKATGVKDPTLDQDAATKKYVDDSVPSGIIASYDTGWVANSDWTNQHLGTAAGGNVVHNLATPLRNLNVKVFISTDGTDANSFEVSHFAFDRAAGANYDFGAMIYQVDNDNLIVQTGAQGFRYLNDVGELTALGADYYRIVVYKMSTVYSATALDYYETPWINTNDWTNRHLGSTILPKNTDSNLNHALNAPLKDLVVKVFVSTDGTDANSFEILTAAYDKSTGSGESAGLTAFAVDNNNIKIQTGTQGLTYILDSGSRLLFLDTENYYYKIKVYKMTAVPMVAARTSYDTGWVSNSDWTIQHLGTTAGGNVIHNLDAPLSDVLVKVLISPTGADSDCFEPLMMTRYAAGDVVGGLTLYADDNDNFHVQTGIHGIYYVGEDGNVYAIATQEWYYKIKVYKLT